jgi:hypothetical protein
MALTELQRPDKATFYNELQHAATQMETIVTIWENIAEFIANIDGDDLDAMGVATGQVRTDLTAFRTSMQEVAAFYRGTSTTQTAVPATVIDKIRRMKA